MDALQRILLCVDGSIHAFLKRYLRLAHHRIRARIHQFYLCGGAGVCNKKTAHLQSALFVMVEKCRRFNINSLHILCIRQSSSCGSNFVDESCSHLDGTHCCIRRQSIHSALGIDLHLMRNCGSLFYSGAAFRSGKFCDRCRNISGVVCCNCSV